MELKHNILFVARAQKGYSIDQLSEKSNVSSQTISRIESGTITPRATTIGKLAAALEISIPDLLKGAE